MTAKRTMIGAVFALSACLIAAACGSSGGGSTCFPPTHGPAGPSCAGFDLGTSCPVGITPWYTCVCSPGAETGDAGADGGSTRVWVCAPAGAATTGGGGMGSGGGVSGSGGSGADGGS